MNSAIATPYGDKRKVQGSLKRPTQKAGATLRSVPVDWRPGAEQVSGVRVTGVGSNVFGNAGRACVGWGSADWFNSLTCDYRSRSLSELFHSLQ